MVSKKSLQDRWLTREGAELAGHVVRLLLSGKSLADAPLSSVDGRLDLRGLVSPWPLKLTDLRLQKVDFSGAQIAGWRFMDSEISSSVFDGADCRDWGLWSSSVADCSFRKADLRNAVISPWYEGKSNVWTRVTFVGSNLDGCRFANGRYEDCDFSQARIRKIRFEGCKFNRCTLAARLQEVTFDGLHPDGDRSHVVLPDRLDLRGAEFRDVSFRRYAFQDVLLPNDADLLLIHNYRRVLGRGIHIVGASNDPDDKVVRAVLENELKQTFFDWEEGLVDLRDFIPVGGTQLAERMRQVLLLAQRQ
jgi:uncharacterized protein YjbI with pentapeptide repeats